MFCVYPPGQQNDRGKRWHCKEIQQLGGTQGTVPCVLRRPMETAQQSIIMRMARMLLSMTSHMRLYKLAVTATIRHYGNQTIQSLIPIHHGVIERWKLKNC